MCLYPRLIKNKKYTITKKNGGNVPTCTDERVKYVPVGCGKCIECMKQKASAWKCRLNEEINHQKGIYVTLTFNDESLIKIKSKIDINPRDIWENEIATYAVRHALENHRKKYKKSVKHWFITELGHEGTERIHLHGIIFADIDLNEFWPYGHSKAGDVANSKTVNYIVKYVTKIDPDHKGFQGKILTSPGIGSKWLERSDKHNNRYRGKNTETRYRLKSGVKINLPIYYRNKIYTEEEREKLWINMLDKQERYVLGQRIDVSQGEDDYLSALEAARAKNERLGFGNDETEWSKAGYLEKLNILKYEKKRLKSKK